MAIESKKYLDLSGLQHLLNKLNDDNRIIKHPTGKEALEGLYKVTIDTNGHVVSAIPVKLADLTDLGAAAKTDIKDSTIKININGVEKEFTLNQATEGNLEFTISAGDLGVDKALHFRGVVEATSEVEKPQNGDVCLIGNKEYIYSDGEWYELGDAESHALKTVKVEGDGVYITNSGNGTLAGDNKLEHKLYKDSKEIGAYKVAIDSAGHISSSDTLTIADNGIHKHTASVTIPGSSFGTSITPSNTKLSISKTGGDTETVVKSYPGEFSKLNTTTITGVGSSTTKASKATKGSAKAVATTDTAVTGVAKVGSSFNYGTADRAATATTVMTGISTDKDAYHAYYNETEACLELSAITITPATKGIYEAIDSGTTRSAIGCADTTGVSITPAKSNGEIDTYTFADVDVPIKATSATTVATGALSATGAGASLMTGLGTASTSTVIKTEKTYSIGSGTTGDVEVMTGATLNKGTNTTATVTVENAGSHNHSFN